ncbi:MAG: ABC transporter ATP-binding protein [Rhodocyclaceae bacterium]
MAEPAPVLATRALCRSFGAVAAAVDVNVAVAEAELVGVIGANGAGKTTFINMVTGYLRPTAGQIVFRGRDITGMPPRRIAREGVCRSFQVSQLFGSLSVLDNMLIALAMLREGSLDWFAPLHGAQRSAQARAELARYGIEEYATRQVATLPQGVKKLLDIAMATVSQPALLLLDEPTSGVATQEKFALMDAVMAPLLAARAACLFVEHDMEIVERHAGRVVAFYEGRVLADGPTAQVLDHPEVRRYVIGAELHRKARA